MELPSIFSKLLSIKQESGQSIRKHAEAKINLIVWIRSLQIFNAILLCFSRLLRNSPRPWVRHAPSPASPDSLEKPHQKAKSSMSLNPYNQIYLASYSLIYLMKSSINFITFHLDMSFSVFFIK